MKRERKKNNVLTEKCNGVACTRRHEYDTPSSFSTSSSTWSRYCCIRHSLFRDGLWKFFLSTLPPHPTFQSGRKDAAKIGGFQTCLFSLLSHSLTGDKGKKTFAAASTALSSSVLQQNCWKPGVVFRNLASTQVKVSHSFNTELVPNQEQSMEPQPPQGAKETRAKLQESRSAIVLSHAQRRRERESAHRILLPVPYSNPCLLSSQLQLPSSKL
jgi:hypothetical protein